MKSTCCNFSKNFFIFNSCPAQGIIEQSADNVAPKSCTFIKFPFHIMILFFKLGYTPCKTEQTLPGMELQEKKHSSHVDHRPKESIL